jgi:hypothetical protein
MDEPDGGPPCGRLPEKPDHFLVAFDREFADVTLISLIGSTKATWRNYRIK